MQLLLGATNDGLTLMRLMSRAARKTSDDRELIKATLKLSRFIRPCSTFDG